MANKRIVDFTEATVLDDDDMLVLGLKNGTGTNKIRIVNFFAAVNQRITNVAGSVTSLSGTVTDLTNQLAAAVRRLSTAEDTLTNKVDKVSGKGLSTNDFTTALQTKLNSLVTSVATTTANGYMSSTDKSKLNNISTAANRVTFSHETKTANLSAAVASGAVATWTVNIASSASGHSYAFLSVDEVCILGDYWDAVHYLQWERSGNTLTVRGRASKTIAQNAVCQVKVSYYETT